MKYRISPDLIQDNYYWKLEDTTVAIIEYDRELDLFSMEVLRPDLFFDRLDKLYFTDDQVRRWFDKRLTPEYQGGYEAKMNRLGLDINDPDHRWKLFILSRGCNVKDYCWLAFNKEETFKEHSPWYRIRELKEGEEVE